MIRTTTLLLASTLLLTPLRADPSPQSVETHPSLQKTADSTPCYDPQTDEEYDACEQVDCQESPDPADCSQEEDR